MSGNRPILIFILIWSLCSACGTSRPLLLKSDLKLDTLTIRLDARRVQQLEYQVLLQQKLQHFVEIYNLENNPFQLKLATAATPADITVFISRARFVSRRQSHIGLLVTAAGVGTATALVLSRFFLPLGWVYIPNAKTWLRAELGTRISNLTDFREITITTTGMYRSTENQMERQSKKVIEYLVQIVLQLETEYKAQQQNKNAGS